MRLLAAARLAASGIARRRPRRARARPPDAAAASRDHGFDRVAVGIGDQLVAVAFVNEGAHLGQRVGGDLAGREGASGQVEQIVQRQRPSWLIFSQPAASCSKALIRPSAARRRPDRARRWAPGRWPRCRPGFGAFGDEQRGGGQRVGVDRGVGAVAVRAQRLDHAGRFAVAGRVVRAHDALQLGELAPMFEPIGRQQGGAVGAETSPPSCCATPRAMHALDAFELGAQLVG